MWVLVVLAGVGFMVLVFATVLLTRRRQQDEAERTGVRSVPYDDEFDRKSVNTVLDWYILRHIEDQAHQPVEQRFLDADRANNDFLNRYYCRLLSKEGVEVALMPSTLEVARRDSGSTVYAPKYFPDQRLDENLVVFKHERIARRLVRTVEYLQRLSREVGEPLGSAEELKPGHWPFVPEGYTAFYNNLVATGQDLDREPGIREQMRKLAAQLVFPRFREHIEFWLEKGLALQQIPEVVARDALQGWFYLEVPPKPMPTPDFLLEDSR